MVGDRAKELREFVKAVESRRRGQLVAIALGFALVWIALLALRRIDGNEVGFIDVALVLLAVASISMLARPDAATKLMARISEIGVGDITVSLAAETQSVGIHVPELEDDARITPRPATTSVPVTLQLIYDRLGTHTRFIRDAELDLGEEVSVADVITQLRELGLLSVPELDMTQRLLGLPEAEIFRLADGDQQRVLDGAWTWVSRLHAEVFDRFVRAELQDANWQIFDFEQGRKHRKDFLAKPVEGGRWQLIAPRPADPPASAIKKTAERLAKVPREPDNSGHLAFKAVAGAAPVGADTAIVAPDYLVKKKQGAKQIEDVAMEYAEKYGGLRVLRLAQLLGKGEKEGEEADD